MLRYKKLKYGIAEKLQPLVIFNGLAPMLIHIGGVGEGLL
jgi:hypothetical protein